MFNRISIFTVLLTAMFWSSACTKSEKKSEPAATDKVDMAAAPESPMDPAAAPADMPAPTDPATAPHAGCTHHKDGQAAPTDPAAAPHAGCPHHKDNQAATGGCTGCAG
ncbi:hypothetical protein KKD52_01675, partial [Myxococcota bacterium]|nr:hypothetical protein [Myxococcota bacterium]MBU1509042.1 hypothetical protein [Myxococcota bacterium]